MSKEDCLQFFVAGRIDDLWIWLIRCRVAQWVNEKGSRSYWTVVYHHAQHMGVLTEQTSIEDFSRLLLMLCPGVTKPGDTPQKLLSSMYKCNLRFSTEEGGASWSKIQELYKELTTLYIMPIPGVSQPDPTDTLEGRLHAYLENLVATAPWTLIKEHPQYKHHTATFSVSTYLSESLMNQNLSSSELVFVCLDERVSEDKVRLLQSKYQHERISRLFLVSTYGFDNTTRSTAAECNVALMRIDMTKKVDSITVVLYRHDSDVNPNREYRQMLQGKLSMAVPLVIEDVDYITVSMSYMLRRYSIPVQESNLIKAPDLTDEEIEQKAMDMIANDLSYYDSILKKLSICDTPPVCSINPYVLADRFGLKVKHTNRSVRGNLGGIHLGNRKVTIHHGECAARSKFSMAHEIGHDVLHAHYNLRSDTSNGRNADIQIEPSEEKRMEHQANHFASCLLMPSPIVRRIFSIYLQKELGMGCQEKLTLGNTERDRYLFHHIVGPVARKMDVSMESMKYRLYDLKLLDVSDHELLKRMK